MNTRQLRDRIELQRRKAQDDGMGGERLPAWPCFARPWAEVMPVKAAETYVAGQQSVEVSHIVTIRYRKDVNRNELSEMRIRLADGRTLEIHGYHDVGNERRFIALACKELA